MIIEQFKIQLFIF